ncbi:MAG: hypothetical protein NUV82_03420 [Candidatus Komeilibacteria bacterium]|nr:hypothetical protein [Candidatus Komeilibacteria bacterium]
MKKLILSFIILIALISVLPSALVAGTAAQENFEDVLKEVGGTAYYNEPDAEPAVTSPGYIAGEVIKIALSFIGLIFVIFIIVSGFQWMTAGGNEDAITKARKRMVNATIGLIIVLGAFVITDYVLVRVINIIVE